MTTHALDSRLRKKNLLLYGQLSVGLLLDAINATVEGHHTTLIQK